VRICKLSHVLAQFPEEGSHIADEQVGASAAK
jgi:hypothetical protein